MDRKYFEDGDEEIYKKTRINNFGWFKLLQDREEGKVKRNKWGWEKIKTARKMMKGEKIGL